MRWTERQRAMLLEMGVRLWSREVATDVREPVGAASGSAAGLRPLMQAQGPAASTDRMAAPTRRGERVAEPLARVRTASDVSRSGAARNAVPATAPEAGGMPLVDQVPADWLVVGEGRVAAAAPTGESAVDAQRQLLANMLRAIGVSHAAATPAWRACHVALGADVECDLADIIDRVRPRIVLAFGRAAAQALLGIDEPIGRLRGQVHECHGIAAIVTFSLAYLLRHPVDKAKAWADLCLAVATAESRGEPA